MDRNKLNQYLSFCFSYFDIIRVVFQNLTLKYNAERLFNIFYFQKGHFEMSYVHS